MRKQFLAALVLVLAAFASCELYNYGALGGADQTGTYYPGDPLFEERMNFLCGVWYSHYAGIGRLDGYRIRKWNDFDQADTGKARALFPGLNVAAPETYAAGDTPQGGDYVLLYDDTAYGQGEDGSGGNESWGFGYMGLVRAVNIFNGDKNRGAIIIEYFEEADPRWLYSSDTYSGHSQGLAKGEKPFFGIYYRALSPNVVQMANAVDLAALYAGDPYYTEKGTLNEAIEANTVENEAEFISWGIVIPQDRE
jgi:hypothetical protein